MATRGDSQLSEIIELMQTPDFYPHPVESIELRETHISFVFLTGDFVYKIKKPVEMDFLDFTTLEKRRYYCEQEIALNRRLTREVYLDVVAITFKNKRYHLQGAGRPVEFAVKMRQLLDGSSMTGLLSNNKLDSTDIGLLASILGHFYRRVPTNLDINTHGCWQTVRRNCEENFNQTEEFAGSLIDRRAYQIIKSATRSFLQRRKALFDERVSENKIREGHGDLRADHVYFTEDGIQIIDCIEFNRRFRCSDIASELAFLAMDLDYEGYPHAAVLLLEAYLRHSGEGDVMALMNFYKCYRAFVRAKVSCLRIMQGELAEEVAAALSHQAMKHVELAYRYVLLFSRPTVWVVCGMIASGKSTIAAALADALQTRALSSDVVRKKLFSRQAFESRDADFGEGIYSEEATALTYGKLLRQAQVEIDRGNSVILDASFSPMHQRREALRLASDMDANIIFIECRCREEIIRQRLKKRTEAPEISDARLKHLDGFKSRYKELDEITSENLFRIDTEKSLKDNVAEILSWADMPSINPP
jgi:aminoglycoside phosphotransferase family enzyme/predicted kinase